MSALVSVVNLKKYFPLKSGMLDRVAGYVRAVDDVTLDIDKGETLGLVGESGSGKTTLARCILKLIDPTAGEIFFEGANMTKLDEAAIREFRRHIQAVFQNPFQSLDPRWSIADIISEPLRTHMRMADKEIDDQIARLMSFVGLGEEQLYKYPHELSGGQAQRVAMARALVLSPKLVILDEPTSALDVSVQAQMLNLLADIKKKIGLTYLFISHDLSVVRYISDRVAIFYAGSVAEIGDSAEVFTKPLHPYSQALLSQVPIPDPKIARSKKKILIKGEIPSLVSLPSGCRFHPRCPYVKEKCVRDEPQLANVENRMVKCWLCQ